MGNHSAYCFGKTLDLSFDEVVLKVRAALQGQGFGILTEIDVQAKFREKLGVDFRPYLILGACNPQMAHRALCCEIDLGVLLPCNVVIYLDDDGRVAVMAMDPAGAMSVIGNPALQVIAGEVRGLLVKALESL